MNITNTLFQTNLTENTAATVTKSSKNTQEFSFESHLAQKTDQTKNNANIKTEERPKTEKPNDKNQTDNTNQVSKDNKTENKSSATDKTEKKDLETKMVEELAEKLNMSVEEVMDILASLQITIFDLVQPEVLGEFVAELMNVDDVSLMLLNDDVAETLTAVQEVLSEFASELEFVSQMETVQEEVLVPMEQVQKNTSTEANAVKQAAVSMEEEFSADADNTPKVEIHVEHNQDNQSLRQQQTKQDTSGQNENMFAKEEIEFLEQPIENPAFQPQTEILEMLNEKVAQATANNYLDHDNIVNQVVERIKVDIRQDVSEIKLMLKPDNLGQVTLKILSENGIISAQILAENQRVKEILESNFNQLRNALQEQGLTVSELNVSVSQQDNNGGGFEPGDGPQGRSQRVQDSLDDFVDGEPIEEVKNPYLVSDSQVDYFA